MKAEYPWSDSGLELLRKISSLILKNGGNFEYAFAIEKEWMNRYQLQKAKSNHRPYEKRVWSQIEINFLEANLHLDYQDIAIQMKDRTPDAVRQKIWYMQKAKRLGSKVAAKNKYKKLNKL